MKTFTDGMILTAEDINTYLVNRTDAQLAAVAEYETQLAGLKDSFSSIKTAASTPPNQSNVSANGGLPIEIITTTGLIPYATNADRTKYEQIFSEATNDKGPKFTFVFPTNYKSIRMLAVSIHNRGIYNFGAICAPYPAEAKGLQKLSTEGGRCTVYGYRETIDDPITIYAYAYTQNAAGTYVLPAPMQDGSRNYLAFIAGEKIT